MRTAIGIMQARLALLVVCFTALLGVVEGTSFTLTSSDGTAFTSCPDDGTCCFSNADWKVWQSDTVVVGTDCPAESQSALIECDGNADIHSPSGPCHLVCDSGCACTLAGTGGPCPPLTESGEGGGFGDFGDGGPSDGLGSTTSAAADTTKTASLANILLIPALLLA